MQFRKAVPSDYAPLCAFYRHVCEHTADMRLYCRWSFGLHPTAEMIRDYIAADVMYLCEEGGAIRAAAALTLSQDEDYHVIDWSYRREDNEVAVVHIFCVHPDAQHTGLGRELMAALIETARRSGRPAVRLDALASNLPAHHFYERLGFVRRGTQRLYTHNAGWTDFYYFELEPEAERQSE